jgi:hypothetical protein
VAGAEAVLQAALKHWQGQAAAKPKDAAAAAGVSWCLQRLVSLKVAQVSEEWDEGCLSVEGAG